MRELVSRCTDRIWQARIPLPFPLRWVNAYLVKDAEGWTIIDPGLHTEEAITSWKQVISELSLSPRDIRQIILTHHHPDHFGLAGWMQLQSGAPVRMSAAGAEQTQRLWGPAQPASALILEQFRTHGMDEHVLTQMAQHMRDFVSMVSPFPECIEPIEEGQSLHFGDASWELIHTPGHAYGHLCLYDRSSQTMFCGDHVLPQITPNVSLLPGVDDNPLESFLASLASLESLPVKLALPGHREPFRTFGERVLSLQQHHVERLEQMRQLLHEPLTVYELCRRLFGQSMSVHQLRFAMAETLAHVACLEKRGQLRLVEQQPSMRYCSLL